jgi:hypothetical protein
MNDFKIDQEPQLRLYIALVMHRWDAVALTGPGIAPSHTVDPGDKSVGYMPVFSSLEDLRAAYPTAQYAIINPDKTQKQKGQPK